MAEYDNNGDQFDYVLGKISDAPEGSKFGLQAGALGLVGTASHGFMALSIDGNVVAEFHGQATGQDGQSKPIGKSGDSTRNSIGNS